MDMRPIFGNKKQTQNRANLGALGELRDDGLLLPHCIDVPLDHSFILDGLCRDGRLHPDTILDGLRVDGGGLADAAGLFLELAERGRDRRHRLLLLVEQTPQFGILIRRNEEALLGRRALVLERRYPIAVVALVQI